MSKPKGRPLSESLDNVSRFFRNVSVTVVRDGGLFMGDDLTAKECAMIATHCARIEAELDRQVAQLRMAMIREEERTE